MTRLINEALRAHPQSVRAHHNLRTFGRQRSRPARRTRAAARFAIHMSCHMSKRCLRLPTPTRGPSCTVCRPEMTEKHRVMFSRLESNQVTQTGLRRERMALLLDEVWRSTGRAPGLRALATATRRSVPPSTALATDWPARAGLPSADGLVIAREIGVRHSEPNALANLEKTHSTLADVGPHLLHGGPPVSGEQRANADQGQGGHRGANKH
jgi:hypothetical protein